MTVIELPDDQAAALKAKAAAQGLPLEDWIRGLAVSETPQAPKKNLVQFFRESPLVGLELEFERSGDNGRDIEL